MHRVLLEAASSHMEMPALRVLESGGDPYSGRIQERAMPALRVLESDRYTDRRRTQEHAMQAFPYGSSQLRGEPCACGGNGFAEIKSVVVFIFFQAEDGIRYCKSK